MNKWKAAGIRALKTTIQTLLASVTVTTLTKEDIRLALITSVGAGVLSLLNSALVNLPEAQPADDGECVPEIQGETVIDTEKEDEELYGGGVNE